MGELHQKGFILRSIDQLKQKTTQGPHKDKIEINLNQKDLKDTGSQGEKKLFISTLKHIETTLKKNPKPIILLDDFFAKLDDENIMKIFSFFHRKFQTIITTTATKETTVEKQIKTSKNTSIKIIKLND